MLHFDRCHVSLSLFPTFPHSNHASEEFGGRYFARLEFNDGGADTDGTVFVWMGMGKLFLFGFFVDFWTKWTERQDEEIWNNPRACYAIEPEFS